MTFLVQNTINIRLTSTDTGTFSNYGHCNLIFSNLMRSPVYSWKIFPYGSSDVVTRTWFDYVAEETMQMLYLNIFCWANTPDLHCFDFIMYLLTLLHSFCCGQYGTLCYTIDKLYIKVLYFEQFMYYSIHVTRFCNFSQDNLLH